MAGEEEEVLFPDPVVLHADMPVEMQSFVFEQAREALTAHKIEKDQATAIKRKCEEEYKGTWHCVVGKSYGVSVANETGFLIFFKIGKVNFLAFQTLDEDPPPPAADE
eukprot:TRINITY_DN53836_c0_g1_i1.p1 TRINITY_DN53836_c0_g1~~TRINITY_DN53836_c0_g1_i1.p1  ORF type:complete len:108 (+),score=27.39 TRINITY_DN53836_c0_g1_i1:154-477(+)